MKIVAVSGGFDPVTIGHIRLLEGAIKLGNYLVVILNNDNWLEKKKGYVFMPQNERKEILESLWCVDDVVLSFHPLDPKDMSVAAELKWLRPQVFANGGDRLEANPLEDAVCREIGCEQVFGVGGGKVQSSSALLKNAIAQLEALK